MNTEQARTAPRRVLVSDSRHWASPAAIHTTLAHAWGDGTGVLVTGARPTTAGRLAERVWRAWGGQVERHPPGWGLHRHSGVNTRAAGADVSVSFGSGGQLSAHHDCVTAIARARRSMQVLGRQRWDRRDSDEQTNEHTHDTSDSNSAGAADAGARDEQGEQL